MSTAFQLRQAARILRAGGLVLYPTEGVWGLGCDPLNPHAVFDILQIKSRPVGKGLIVITDQAERLTPYVDNIADLPPPGDTPTTWLVRASDACPWWLTGGWPTLAVRITRHGAAAALCAHVGHPLVSTSANPGGRSAPRLATQINPHIRRCADLKLGGQTGNLRGATPIRVAGSGDYARGGSANG